MQKSYLLLALMSWPGPVLAQNAATNATQLPGQKTVQFPAQSAAQSVDKCFAETTPDGVFQSCVGHPFRGQVDFQVDVSQRSIQATATVDFTAAPQAGKVWFLLEQGVQSARLDGQPVTVQQRKTPDGENKIVELPIRQPSRAHRLELNYAVTGLTRWGLSWQPFHWVTDFSDSSDARFSNAFAPSSYEADRYPMIWNFRFAGLRQPLQVYTSASGVQHAEAGHFQLRFDSHSNLASPYFEFTSQVYQTRHFGYQGLYQAIPVTLYLDPAIGRPKGLTATTLLNQAEALTRQTLHRFETRFGPYAFASLLVKVYSLQTGDLPLTQEYSMEYGGAVVSRMELVPHEICHQWFGRGASPADGQAGFVDEVICDWYDYDNPVLAPAPHHKPVQLVPSSPWTLRTPEESYQEGLFMAGLAWRFQQEKKSVYDPLRTFYLRHRQGSYSQTDFLAWLDQAYTGDLAPSFQRDVYGLTSPPAGVSRP